MSRPPRKRRTSIDWDAVRERRLRAEAALAQALVVSPERAKALMDERARALARPTGAAAPGETLELLSFELGKERYAIEPCFVREVTRLRDFTPIPMAPDFIVGITNLRGEVLAIIDLRKFFNVEDQGLTDLSRVVVLGRGEAELGILVDSAHSLDRIPTASVLGGGHPVAGIGNHYVRGVTVKALIVLDGAALLEDPRFVVDQTQSAPTR